MLNKEDTIKMKKLMEENPDFSEIITKLIRSQEVSVAKITHEIRNPLTLISSSLQLIQSQHPEVKTYKHWNDIREDIEFMKNLLSDLSSYTHSRELNMISFDFTSLLKSCITLFEAEFKKSKIQLIIYYPKSLPLIKGDPVKLKQVIINLLKNAYEAVECDKGIIRISLCRFSNYIQLHIIDNGYGIPEDFAKNLFTPFTTSKSNGTGLGLAISKQIIESHNGSISFTSVKNKGTTFTVTLPIVTSI